jgi:hypothetical protein
MLLAVPVGFFGGALAGALIGEGTSAAMVILGCCEPNSYLLNPLANGLIEYMFFGALTGVLCFPIAYAAVARTRHVLAVLPVALLATVLSGWFGLTIVDWLNSNVHYTMWQTPWTWLSLTLIIVFPVASMFWACAWAAARERAA